MWHSGELPVTEQIQMKSASLALLALLVAGCAKEPPVTTVVDAFCLTSKKRTWDPDTDSVETMREAVVWNRYVDKRCGTGKVPAA